MAPTPTQQRNAVSEGAALGLVLNGVSTLPDNKTDIDLTFAAAFRNWQYADRFPTVRNELAKHMEGRNVLIRAGERQDVWALYWEHGRGVLSIVARQDDWDPFDEADVDYAVSVISGDVPREGWATLAEDFLRRLG